MRAFARSLVVAGVGAAVAAFFIASRTAAVSPWPMFVLGFCLTLLGVVLITRRRPES